MIGERLTEEDRVWRGLAMLAEAERKAWRRGFNIGLVCGAFVVAAGTWIGLWLWAAL